MVVFLLFWFVPTKRASRIINEIGSKVEQVDPSYLINVSYHFMVVVIEKKSKHIHITQI